MDRGAECYRLYLDGSDDGLTELIREYRDGLILFILGITGDIADAEEIAEDVFFRLAVKKPKYRGGSSFRTWLYAIGRNAALDRLRHRARYAPKPPEDYAETLRDIENLEAGYIRDESKILLHRCMEKLNPVYRQALWLSYFEELDNAGCAAVLGKTKRQTENILHRARAALRKEMEREGFSREDI